MRAAAALGALAGGAVGLSGTPAMANDNPVILQWFEIRWPDLEYRVPDMFMAGYGGIWLPPISQTADPNSPGFDPIDRFDLGSPSDPTAYGTEQGFRAVVEQLKRANQLIYVDSVMNHNSGRNGSLGFQQAGGWPGFWMGPIANPPRDKQPTDNWGDFHNGISSGYYQSENPGGPRYCLLRGDLVALVDINQEINNQFIRHPTTPGDPRNIPAGTVFNRPNPANAALYPDRQLPGQVVNNPGMFANATPPSFGAPCEFPSRNVPARSDTFFPFNTVTPLAGDPIQENATGLLLRWTQWMLDVYQIDGFRLDAAKHVPPWFWDTFWDSMVHQRRTTPDGRKVTPFSFGEVVDGNQFVFDFYVRKPNGRRDGSRSIAGDAFGNRDALDLSGAGAYRDLLNAGGFGNWSSVLSGTLDTVDDGFNNGTIGVNHFDSHDNSVNTSPCNGNCLPDPSSDREQGFVLLAHILTRPGQALVYHNSRGVPRNTGFFPRAGTDEALGYSYARNQLSETVTRLVGIHNGYVRGNDRGRFFQLVGNPADLLAYELSTPTVPDPASYPSQYSANLLVGLSDRFDNGTLTATVTTTFPPGTRLFELTGNAADPRIDTGNTIPEVLTVNASRQVTLTVPNNSSSAWANHARGYVIYGPATPNGTLSVTPTAGTIAADPLPGQWQQAFRTRLTSIPIVTSDTFRVQLTTSNGDPQGIDQNTDDKAVFRINAGYIDLNNSGGVDYNFTNAVNPGYEDFNTINVPMFGSGNANGQYAQDINTAQLPEGYNYISALAFRKRDANQAPLFREFRRVIYVDRVAPVMNWLDQTAQINTNSFIFRIGNPDRTATTIHLLWDLPAGVDPVPLVNSQNRMTRFDRTEYRIGVDSLTWGNRSFTLVAFEPSGRVWTQRVENVQVRWCRPDTNGDGSVNINDFFRYLSLFSSNDINADFDDSGVVDINDFFGFLSAYAQGC